ncbi:MAG: hypothetical protein P0S94_03770 [Simkaniaceae bacterium]|nr:hypothetical protein [Simkaniaceae bacterium]
MKRWMICVLLTICLMADEELTDHQKKIFAEATHYITEILPLQPLGIPVGGSFKAKYKVKGVSSRKHTLKEENLYDAREIHIPKGVELAQTLSAGSEIGKYIKLLSELSLTAKYLSNGDDPQYNPHINNALKCKLGLTLTPWDFFELEGFFEEKMTHSFELDKYRPIKSTLNAPAFDQYTIKFKFKY